MSELRRDRTSGRWTIIAPGRRDRPFRRHAGHETGAHAEPVACPFCPGHEAELPGIIAETKTDAPPGWRVRIVPNKFPALRADPSAPAIAPPGDQARPGFGTHEVVIESPRHDSDLTDLTRADRLTVTSIYRERSRVLLGRPAIEAVVLFRNHGASAGASQDHPHSQIIALGLVPHRLQFLVDAGLHYFEDNGCCATCAELDIERRDGRRLVSESEFFVALVPFAAEHPFETWLVPKTHRASFADIDDAELADFSNNLGATLQRLKRVTLGAAYRFVVDTAPRAALSAPYFHWRLRIVPELVTPGGFELGTDMAINPSRPEDDAADLRNAH